jgi:MoaA/NifB/PqqE/SkfB family radical SAM enzyme
MFDAIQFDIVGGCNAKCPLCSTARLTFGQRLQFIPVADFARTLDRILELGLATPGRSLVRLYNWGEPILHPDLNGIVREVGARGLLAGISTNASKRTNFTISTKHFGEFTFSMPGWSQSSYDKVHGLRFERVVANMEATIKNMRHTGYRGGFLLAYHVYQFNCFDELAAARRWCKNNDVKFFPYYAYINDYEQSMRYHKGEMDRDEIDELSRTLFLHHVNDLKAQQPKNYQCPQWEDQLTLDHRSRVLLCCAIPDSNPVGVLGSIFELSRDQILALKTTNSECDDCLSCGQAYVAHHYVRVMADPPTLRSKVGSWLRSSPALTPMMKIADGIRRN